MGTERLCRVKLGRRTVEGKAHLESTEISFRGDDLRLKIAFQDMQRIAGKAGALTVTFPGGTAVFQLGPDAERWAEKIRNPKSLLDKLGVKPEHRVVALGVRDEGFLADLRARAPDVSVGRKRKDADIIFLGAETPAELAKLPQLRACIRRDGAIWTVTPKGKGGIKDTDVIAAGKRAGLVDVKVAAFSPTHSASKFVIPKAQR
ncbi:MAG: DUF3052 domain-containing protein [Dehalococcoidia bacterium]